MKGWVRGQLIDHHHLQIRMPLFRHGETAYRSALPVWTDRIATAAAVGIARIFNRDVIDFARRIIQRLNARGHGDAG
ncbi:hypothetical protein D3C72_2098060 [compost metagenome]